MSAHRQIRTLRGPGSGAGIPAADEPVRDFPFIALFNGAPDLAKRPEEILREEFAKRSDTGH